MSIVKHKKKKNKDQNSTIDEWVSSGDGKRNKVSLHQE
jgi:hypothetical protein